MPLDMSHTPNGALPVARCRAADGSIVNIPLSIDPFEQMRSRATKAETVAADMQMLLEQAVEHIVTLEKHIADLTKASLNPSGEGGK